MQKYLRVERNVLDPLFSVSRNGMAARGRVWEGAARLRGLRVLPHRPVRGGEGGSVYDGEAALKQSIYNLKFSEKYGIIKA